MSNDAGNSEDAVLERRYLLSHQRWASFMNSSDSKAGNSSLPLSVSKLSCRLVPGAVALIEPLLIAGIWAVLMLYTQDAEHVVAK